MTEQRFNEIGRILAAHFTSNGARTREAIHTNFYALPMNPAALSRPTGVPAGELSQFATKMTERLVAGEINLLAWPQH